MGKEIQAWSEEDCIQHLGVALERKALHASCCRYDQIGRHRVAGR